MPLTLVNDLVRGDGMPDCIKHSGRILQKEVILLRWE
jgi:hypothetical protein